MFADLLAHPGVTETVELRSEVGFLAYHGGNLERVTDVVAERAAAAAGASYYGVCQPDDLHWHLPSTTVGRERSDALDAFLDHVDVAISIHGYGRQGLWTSLLLGGQHRALAEHVAAHLVPALPDYEIVSDLADIPKALRGVHRDNPVNLPRHGGVQVELPPRVRGMGPKWADWTDGLVPPTEALIAALAEAAQSWPPDPT